MFSFCRAGLRLKDFTGSATKNTITGFYYGVYSYNPYNYPKVSKSKIQQNRGYGVYSDYAHDVSPDNPLYLDATQNWWGDASGPKPYGICNEVWGWENVQPWEGQTVWYARVDGHDPHCPPPKAEPVNPNTGNFFHIHKDFSFPATGPRIEITRSYNSLIADKDGQFGYGWNFTYSERIEPYLPDYVPDDKCFVNADGDYKHYISNGDGTWHPEDEDYSFLKKNGDGTWTISYKDGSSKNFDSSGLISEIKDSKGNKLRIERDENSHILYVIDACNQKAEFEYNSQGKISKIKDPAGTYYEYEYDDNGDLKEVKYPNGQSTKFTYDDKHRIKSVIDPVGNEFVKNEYDELNRVVKQWDAFGNEVSFTYDMANHENTFTDALESKSSYSSDKKLYQTGEKDALGNDKLDIKYDDKGNVISRTDKLGNTTTYTYVFSDRIKSPPTTIEFPTCRGIE